ncbi:hypothetical protein QL285_009405 [Trifolium repens]|nr:hypothetical protein QL285_009405 [Trifolium repens]
MSVEYFERRLKLADEKSYKLTPVAFEISQFCTYEFATWWSLHYEKHAKNTDEVLLQAIEAGFDALQQKTPKGKGASKAKETTTSTDTTTPAATQKKSLPNTGAKLRKRNLMATNETGEPTKKKKQKALTINEPTPADDVPTTTNAVAPSGESQGDKGKANVETSEASMPTKPKKKKKKVKSKSKPSESQKKEGESPIPTVPVENQPPPAVEEQPITGVQGGNEENLAQSIGTNDAEANQDGNDKEPDTEEIPIINLDSEKTITMDHTESTHSSENTDVEMELDNEDDSMPEATEGGSEILPVSSTSKLSADIGISEMQFIAMKDSDPAAALKMLLSSKELLPVLAVLSQCARVGLGLLFESPGLHEELFGYLEHQEHQKSLPSFPFDWLTTNNCHWLFVTQD